MRTVMRDGKRNRLPTSCEPCRIRKSRCNRALPCDSCVARNKQSSCQYAGDANRGKHKQSRNVDRLQNLENMVLQFVQNGTTGKPRNQISDNGSKSMNHEGGSGTTASNTPTEKSGTLHVRDGQMNYVDSSHWLSILQDIKEVREELSLSDTQVSEDQSFDDLGLQPETELMFGPMQPVTVYEILRSLPPRPICDSLLSQFFNGNHLILPTLHPVQFLEEYEQFWQDSSRSPTLWIGLLFSILSLMTTFRQCTKVPLPIDSDGHAILPETLRLRTTQCLVLGNYSTANAYGLETLMLHFQSNHMGLADSNINLWFFVGIIIRLAMRMGYHRDPKIHSKISPFEGEMRRRIWARIYTFDVLMSFQLGLPSMIPSEYCDTEPPRNLNFSDFSPDTAVLPPARPLSDHTLVSYLIVKSEVMKVFKKIVAHTQSLVPPPLEITIMLDMEIRETYNNLPKNFKMIPVNRSLMDSSSTIIERCCVELLYLKGIVVLHRRFLNRDISNLKYAKLRHTCVDAAMDILLRQADLHQASQPGGQLYDDRWMVSSLTAHDFLLAAMVVCLELSMHMRTATTPRDAEFARQFDALKTSHAIWKSRTAESKEARTAAQVLGLMIRAINDDTVNRSSSSASPQTDNLLSDDSKFPYTGPVTEMIDGSEDLNWALLDQYFRDNQGLQEFTSLGMDIEEQGIDLLPSMGEIG